ncbi:MAG TPA: hypothetical protein VME17_09345 [Bryobacteraceae bacterium]|nr:hypothetical protein [Bryobacteraceae bacterium]
MFEESFFDQTIDHGIVDNRAEIERPELSAKPGVSGMIDHVLNGGCVIFRPLLAIGHNGELAGVKNWGFESFPPP